MSSTSREHPSSPLILAAIATGLSLTILNPSEVQAKTQDNPIAVTGGIARVPSGIGIDLPFNPSTYETLLDEARKPLRDLHEVLRAALTPDFQDPRLEDILSQGTLPEIVRYRQALMRSEQGRHVWGLELGSNHDRFQIEVFTEPGGRVSRGLFVGDVQFSDAEGRPYSPRAYIPLEEQIGRVAVLSPEADRQDIIPGGLLAYDQREKTFVQALLDVNGGFQVDLQRPEDGNDPFNRQRPVFQPPLPARTLATAN